MNYNDNGQSPLASASYNLAPPTGASTVSKYSDDNGIAMCMSESCSTNSNSSFLEHNNISNVLAIPCPPEVTNTGGANINKGGMANKPHDMVAKDGRASTTSNNELLSAADNRWSQQSSEINGNSTARSKFNTCLGHGSSISLVPNKKNKVWRAEYTRETPPVPVGVTSPSPVKKVRETLFSFMENDTRCVINKYLFTHLKYMFETGYGMILKRDLCATSKNALLSVYGFPRLGNKLDNGVYINSPPSWMDNIIKWIKAAKVVSLIVTPIWPNHLWHNYLMMNATHRFICTVGAAYTGHVWGVGVQAFIIDTRFDSRATDMITISTPDIDILKKIIYTPHQCLSMQSTDFLKARPKAHLSVAWFLKWGKGIHPPLFRVVLTGMHVGFRTHYRGGGEILRNYASQLSDLDEKKAIETAQKAVAKGWAAGPFDLPPFPNKDCAMQAIVTKLFTIPKHKWISDGDLRLIFHKSFPPGLSINSLTPRHDVASFFPKGCFKYLTLAKIMSIIAKAGRGSLITIFDARDAYKQLLVHLADLFQQVFMAGGKYYVDFCAAFGSVYGSDSYSCFAYVHCICLALAARLSVLEVYVDNYFKLTPFAGTDKQTKMHALEEDVRMKKELHNSGIRIHQFEGPTTRVTFIGWEIDTQEMTVSIPQPRMQFMISYLEQWQGKTTFTHKELSSLIGLLIFISQVVGGIKPTIGVLLEKKTQMARTASTKSTMSERLNWAIEHILYVLKRWKGIARIYDKCWHNNKPDIIIYCDVAIGDDPKAGAYGKGGFALPSMKWFTTPWTNDELCEAMREKKHSSTHLEVLNMLEAVLFFASEKQRVLCVNDNTSAVRIATARYSASANIALKKRLNDFDLKCCEKDISVKFVHVRREVEPFPLADQLSRGQVDNTTY